MTAPAGEVPAAAVDRAVAVVGTRMFADPEQVELALGEGPRDTAGLRTAIVQAKGAGRPKGALNRRTGDWRDYLASQYRHPLVTLAQIQASDPDQLAVELNCRPVEALAVIKSAAAELAPYMEGKMPVVIEAKGRGHMTLMMVDAATAAQLAGGGSATGEAAPLIGFASQQNQHVSDDDPAVSE